MYSTRTHASYRSDAADGFFPFEVQDNDFSACAFRLELLKTILYKPPQKRLVEDYPYVTTLLHLVFDLIRIGKCLAEQSI